MNNERAILRDVRDELALLRQFQKQVQAATDAIVPILGAFLGVTDSLGKTIERAERLVTQAADACDRCEHPRCHLKGALPPTDIPPVSDGTATAEN